jgi:hypothetical protein
MEPTKLSDMPIPAKKLSPGAIKTIMAALAMATTVGLKERRLRNAARRAREQEPEPGFGAGVKRHARYLSRVASAIKLNPEAHIHPRHKRAA